MSWLGGRRRFRRSSRLRLSGRVLWTRPLKPKAAIRKALRALAEPIAQKILQVVDPVNLLDRRLHVVLDAAEADRLVVEQDVAGPPVAVARLADRADVAERLAAVQFVGVFDFFRAVELQ